MAPNSVQVQPAAQQSENIIISTKEDMMRIADD
jgi:hypothetical protein